MIVLEGNLLDTPFEIIAHQVNCMGVMGAGLAKQIKDKYPTVYREYKRVLDNITNSKLSTERMLGKAQMIFTSGHTFFNIFGQYRYGRDGQYTDYDAFRRAFYDAVDSYRGENEYQITIAIPYGIGAGLAGGDWDTIVGILTEIEKDLNVVFVAHKLNS